jgi:hypothetical protein
MIPKYTKYIVILLVVIIAIVLLIVYAVGKGQTARAYFLTSVLFKYIENNNGAYPETEESLENQGYLKLVKNKDGSCQYYFRRELTSNWREFPEYTEDTFLYGVDVDDIKIVDDILVDKMSGKQILLIDGPYKLLLKGTYEYFTYEIYKDMLRYKMPTAGGF